jgi:hypothetical protein
MQVRRADCRTGQGWILVYGFYDFDSQMRLLVVTFYYTSNLGKLLFLGRKSTRFMLVNRMQA